MIQTKAQLTSYYKAHGGYSIANAKKVQALNSAELASTKKAAASTGKVASKVQAKGTIGTSY